MNILLIYPILIQRSWVYNDQVSAGQGRPISVSKMKLFKFLNIDFELDSSAESADEDEPDQRRPFGCRSERLNITLECYEFCALIFVAVQFTFPYRQKNLSNTNFALVFL